MGVEQRRLRERKQRKVLIIEAALRVFTEKGIKNATIDDIATDAELGKGTIYYYFESKEAILESAIKGTVDAHFIGILEHVAQLQTPYNIASAVLSGCADNFRKHPAMFKLLYMVLAEPNGRYQDVLHVFVRRHMEWLEELRALTKPILSQYDIDSQTYLHFIGTHVHGMMVLASSGRSIDVLLKDSLNALEKILSNIQEVS